MCRLSIVIWLLFCVQAFGFEFRRGTTFYDAWAASCRVSVNGARGSGMFIGYDAKKDRCVILTNQHVVGNQNDATMQFRTNGDVENVRGTVYARYYCANPAWDFALIGVEPALMAKFDPPYFPISGRGVFPSENSYIISSGAPKGRFVQCWKGRIIERYNGSTILFQPGPVPGQSGSAIISEIDGELWVTGILTWLIGTEGADDSRGGAIPIANLYDAVQGRRGTSFEDSPIPPGAVECVFIGNPESLLEVPVVDGRTDIAEIAEKASRPFVFEFTRDNCQPCVVAEKDVQTLREAQVDLYRLNVSQSPEAQEHATKLKVRAYPTFIVFNADGERRQTFVGPGRAAEIIQVVEALTVGAADPADTDLIPPQPPVEPDALQLNFEEEKKDFRLRDPISQPADSDFFDEADAFWRNRRKPQEPETENRPPESPQIDEDALGDRIGSQIGGRLKDGLSEALGRRVEGLISGVEEKLEEKINNRIDQMKKEALAKYNALKFRIFMLFLGAVVVSVLFAESIKVGITFLKNALFNYLDKKAQKIAAAAGYVKKAETKENGPKEETPEK